MALVFGTAHGNAAAKAHVNGTDRDLTTHFTDWTGFNVTVTELEDLGYGRRCYLTGSPGQPRFLQSVAMPSMTTLAWGALFYRATGASDFGIIQIRNSGGIAGSIAVVTDGRLSYSIDQSARHNQGVQSLSTITVPFGWSYIENKVFIHNSTGTVDWKINGVAAGSDTGKDTLGQGSDCTYFRTLVGTNGTSNNLYWNSGNRIADIYVDNADFQANPQEFWYQPSDSVGTAAGFTPSGAATNHEAVDEIGNDGETTHNESTAVATLDQLGHSFTLPSAPTAIQPINIARFVSPGVASQKLGVLSGATHDQSAEIPVSSGYYGYRGKWYPDDPNTAAPWTSANADAAETSCEHSS